MKIDKNTSVCLVCVRSCVKIDSIDMLKFTYTHKFQYVWFLVFGFRFHVKNIDIYLICILDSIHTLYASNIV